MNGISKPEVLVVCQNNQCLSQMAEGFLNAFAGEMLQVRSAGFKPAASVHPMAMRVMAELGLDISHHKTRSINEFLHFEPDALIILASTLAPPGLELPKAGNLHEWFFDDPAQTAATEEQRLSFFRRVRDEIRRVCEAYANGRGDAETAILSRWSSGFTPV